MEPFKGSERSPALSSRFIFFIDGIFFGSIKYKKRRPKEAIN